MKMLRNPFRGISPWRTSLLVIMVLIVIAGMYLSQPKRSAQSAKAVSNQTDSLLQTFDERSHQLMLQLLAEEREEQVAAAIGLMLEVEKAQNKCLAKGGGLAITFQELVDRGCVAPDFAVAKGDRLVIGDYYISLVGTTKKIQMFANNPNEGAGFVIYSLLKKVGEPYKLFRITNKPTDTEEYKLEPEDITAQYKPQNNKTTLGEDLKKMGWRDFGQPKWADGFGGNDKQMPKREFQGEKQ